MDRTLEGTPDREPGREENLGLIKEVLVELSGADPAGIDETSRLEHYFADSLALTEGVMATEDKLKLKIPEERLSVLDPESGKNRTIQTVGELLDVIAQIQAEQESGEG